MEFIVDFLSKQPFLALFLVVALGYGIGSINIKGFSLGVGAIIFSGLFIGAIAPKAQPPAMVGTLGLVMFLYGLGVQFGKQFFAGLSGATGRKYNLVALVALVSAAFITFLLLKVMNVSNPLMAGIFAGSGTNAASMQAAAEAAQSNEPAIGYGVAYPFGLVGAILCMYIMQLIVKPDIDKVSGGGLERIEVEVKSPEVAGKTLGEIMQKLPPELKILVVRSGNENRHPDPGMIIGTGDALFIGGKDKASLETAAKILGEKVTGSVVNDRSSMDLLFVFVSNPKLIGTRLSDLKMPDGIDATVTHLQRGDTEMLISPDLTMEVGDRIGLIVHRNSFPAMRKFFGNSIRGTSEFSYISLGIGMVLGVLLGITPIPLPFVGTIKLGIAGGSLIVALILGKLGRTGKLTWTMPLSANLTLRNFGLSIFLAQVGMSSGAPFVNVVSESGLALLGAGACILFALALIPLLIGHFVLRIPFDDLLGITAGVTGTPALLAYAYRSFPSERVEICYAMIYPAATIMKIIIALIIISLGTAT
jgi:putative transport protein